MDPNTRPQAGEILEAYVQSTHQGLEKRLSVRRLRGAIGALLIGATSTLVNSISTEAETGMYSESAYCPDGVTMLSPETPPERVKNEPLKERIAGRLEQVPSLNELGGQFPREYSTVNRDLAFITDLDKTVSVTACDYADFGIDTTHNTAFVGMLSNKTIQPGLLLFHWTVNRYQNGPVEMANGIRPEGKSVAYMIDHTHFKTYSLLPSDTQLSAHAKGLNGFSQGVEIEAVNLYDIRPAQIKQAVMLTVDFCRRNNLAINKYTVMGHMAGDVLFLNPSFNAKDGTVKSLRRGDMPQELVQVIMRKAQELDALVG